MQNVTIHKRAFNAVFLPLLDNQSRYLVLYGGAGSGKSFFAVQRFVYRMLRGGLRLLVVRQTAKSNRDSTFSLFKQVISLWGLNDLFKINESDLRIKCSITGSQIIFAGLDDVEKLKSITFESGALNSIWIEEASEVSEQDFNQLDIRLRGGSDKKQIVLSFNPVNINHWLKRKFFDTEQENATVLKTTYKDNKFIDSEYKQLLENYRTTDPYSYSVYCLGNWGVFGSTVFDSQKLQERIPKLPTAKKHGYFSFSSDGLTIDNIEFIPDNNGALRIYKDVIKGHPYVIGCDTAGEGSDSFVCQVLDNTTGEQVAVLRQSFDEDVFSKQVYCLGMYYNVALIGIETNFSTYPIRELERLRYPKQYVRESIDTYTHKPSKSFGFRTTSASRPVIIADLIKIVRETPELINDYTTIDEMLTFVRNEKGRAEAMQGSHDDCIMALAIAHFIRPQQSYIAEISSEALNIEWSEDMWEDYNGASESDKKKIIEKWGKPN